VDFVAEAGI